MAIQKAKLGDFKRVKVVSFQAVTFQTYFWRLHNENTRQDPKKRIERGERKCLDPLVRRALFSNPQ